MAPFAPDLISDQLNLVVALVLGVGFGFVLEQAGFSSSRRLAGLFYGYDFTVLRVFFTAALTAMAGVLLLGSAGWLDTGAIFVNPTWLAPAIVGGIIMGLGFILGGYCPGTSICAAAIGKIDAIFFVLGGFLGVFAFGEAYPLLKHFNDSTALGPVKVFSSLGISQGLFIVLLVVAAVGAFSAAAKVEKLVDPAHAPSLAFPVKRHVALGAGLVAFVVAIALLPDYRSRLLTGAVKEASVAANPAVGMTSDELAFRIVDHEPRLRIVDVRSPAAFASASLPGSANLPLADLLGKEAASTLSQRHVKKLIVGDGEDQERAAYFLLKKLGYENLAILEGGMPAFNGTILAPASFVSTGSRWDGDVKRFRDRAKTEILRQMQAAKAGGAKKPKVEKKVQGGC
jgi:rhodanese-related sulfurtransferase